MLRVADTATDSQHRARCIRGRGDEGAQWKANKPCQLFRHGEGALSVRGRRRTKERHLPADSLFAPYPLTGRPQSRVDPSQPARRRKAGSHAVSCSIQTRPTNFSTPVPPLRRLDRLLLFPINGHSNSHQSMAGRLPLLPVINNRAGLASSHRENTKTEICKRLRTR